MKRFVVKLSLEAISYGTQPKKKKNQLRRRKKERPKVFVCPGWASLFTKTKTQWYSFQTWLLINSWMTINLLFTDVLCLHHCESCIRFPTWGYGGLRLAVHLWSCGLLPTWDYGGLQSTFEAVVFCCQSTLINAFFILPRNQKVDVEHLQAYPKDPNELNCWSILHPLNIYKWQIFSQILILIDYLYVQCSDQDVDGNFQKISKI